jgi:hypothetical protein
MVIAHKTFQDQIILYQRTTGNGICRLKLLRHFIGYFSLKNSVERANWSFAQKEVQIGQNLNFPHFSTLFFHTKKSAPLFSLLFLSRVPFFSLPPFPISLL